MRVQLLEVFFGLCVALFVFFGLCALRTLIIRRFIDEHCEVIEGSDEHAIGNNTSGSGS